MKTFFTRQPVAIATAVGVISAAAFVYFDDAPILLAVVNGFAVGTVALAIAIEDRERRFDEQGERVSIFEGSSRRRRPIHTSLESARAPATHPSTASAAPYSFPSA